MRVRPQKIIPRWLRNYQRSWLARDSVAGLVTSMLIVPQGLAYAVLAGLPPHLGLYASLIPLIAYAAFGSSAAMSVGPVAVLSLMVGSALSPLAPAGSAEYTAAAIMLATLSGLFLLALGILRMGALSNLLSSPVIGGFVAGAAILIIIGQIPPLLGIKAEGDTAILQLLHTVKHLPSFDPLTALTGLSALIALAASKIWLAYTLFRAGINKHAARLFAKLSPMLVVLCSIAAVKTLHLEDRLDLVGTIPAGLPQLELPAFNWRVIHQLAVPALIIALLAFIESVSIAQAVASRKGKRLNPNAELKGLGAANLASAFSGGFPVAGSFSRTAVNAEAGAMSPMAGVIAALLMAFVLTYLAGLFSHLPITVLAATIIVAAAALFNLRGFIQHWRYDRTDGVAMTATCLGVLLFGVEVGIALGIGLSFATLIWRSSRPHIAVVGRVPGTEHFRNTLRHTVETKPEVLFLRIDESLFFSNINAIEGRLLKELKRHADARDLVLILSSVSRIDGTALERLQQLNRDLLKRGIRLHLAEVKGPVLDRLSRSKFLEQLSGRIFLSSYIAELALQHETDQSQPPPETA